MADTTTVTTSLTWYQYCGAFGFGALIGWNVYYVNRYRKDVAIGDLASMLTAIGGAAITALFDKGGLLFGAYGIGLFTGFFSYFAFLLWLVHRSEGFTIEWFLDGRRPKLDEQNQQAGDGTRPFGVPSQRGSENLSFELPGASSGSDLSTLIADWKKVHVALTALIDEPTTDGATRKELETGRTNLENAIMELEAEQLRLDFASPEVQNAVTELKDVTSALKAEAQTMQNVTQVIAITAKVLEYVQKLVALALKAAA
jgi:hypothetical protein